MHSMEIALASNDIAGCTALAGKYRGHLYTDERDTPKLPFRALLSCATDDLEPFAELADAGLYVVCRRVIKPGAPKVVGLFPMRLNEQRSRAENDGHWRDVHAPLALEHHAHMTAYAQLSVVHTLQGLPLDGFALCGFDSAEDLRKRFYTREESIRVIADDVRKFADPENSPRRLVAAYHRF